MQRLLWVILSVWALGLDSLGLCACEALTGASESTSPGAVQPTQTPGASTTGLPDQGNVPGSASTPAPLPSASPTTTAVFNCDNANFPVCDGFETVTAGGLPDPNRWSSAVGPSPDDGAVSDHPTQNLLEVTSVRAHRGTQSLHIHTVGGTEHLVIRDLVSATYPHAFLPAPHNTFYVRLWVFDNGFGGDLTQVPPGSSHLYMVNASGPLAGRQQYEKFGAGDGPSGPATLNWNYYGNDAIVTDAGHPWPLGTWTCFETGFNGTTGELTVWQNDTAVPGLHIAAGTWTPPAYNRLVIGWEMDHPPSGFAGTDVYIDDLAYSYTRIGCAP